MSRPHHPWKRPLAVLLLGVLLIAATVGAVFWQLGFTVSPKDWAATHTTAPLRLSLNTATTEELLQLPDMTEELAAAIVDFRSRSYPFRSVEELLQLYGVTEELYNRWKPYIYV